MFRGEAGQLGGGLNLLLSERYATVIGRKRRTMNRAFDAACSAEMRKLPSSDPPSFREQVDVHGWF